MSARKIVTQDEVDLIRLHFNMEKPNKNNIREFDERMAKILGRTACSVSQIMSINNIVVFTRKHPSGHVAELPFTPPAIFNLVPPSVSKLSDIEMQPDDVGKLYTRGGGDAWRMIGYFESPAVVFENLETKEKCIAGVGSEVAIEFSKLVGRGK